MVRVADRPADTRRSTRPARSTQHGDAPTWCCQVASPCAPRTPQRSAITRPHHPVTASPCSRRQRLHSGVSTSSGGSSHQCSCRVRADCPVRSMVAGQHPSSHRHVSEIHTERDACARPRPLVTRSTASSAWVFGSARPAQSDCIPRLFWQRPAGVGRVFDTLRRENLAFVFTKQIDRSTHVHTR